MRSVTRRVRAIALAARQKGSQGEERRRQHYRELLKLSRQILNDTRRVIAEVEQRADKSRRRFEPLTRALSETADRVRQVIRQTKARVFEGITQSADKIVSLFEPHTEIVRKGKASKPTEFGKLVQIQEAENQIVTHYEVFGHRPSDRELLTAAVEAHERKLKRVPRLVAADAGFWSQKQEQAVREKGVRWISVPNRATKSADRKQLERSRWFKKAQAWRTGCEGRISVLKRRHGLSRCRYRGFDGIKRWVGLGVIADNLINIGSAMAVSRP
jgi:IS5 family transposase